PSTEESLGVMKSLTFDPDSTVILHEEIKGSSGGTGTANIVSWEPQRYEIDVYMQGAGFLVLSEAWYPPGWHATVDGENVQILRANHTFQAIALGDGNHKVIVEFNANSFSMGLALSRGLFWLIILLLIGYAIYGKRDLIMEKFGKS
ncbi:MAG: YfhO family protein, partial [Candidatus Marinimicrobia bacterium]|nr:YfhO family protein [Candidatus Neomarinimicrobiota bacterium]